MKGSLEGFRVVLSSLVMVSAAPLTAQNVPDPQSPNLPPGFAAPAVIGRYVRGSSHDYGTPGLGVAYRYNLAERLADSSYATLYLYQRDKDEQGLSAESILARSVADFKERLKEGPRKGDFDSYEIISEGPDSVVVGKTWKLPGYRLAYSYRVMLDDRVSYLYLFVAGNALVKVRATVPESHWSETDLPTFAHAVVIESVVDKRRASEH